MMSEGNQLQRFDVDPVEPKLQPQSGARDSTADLSHVLKAVTAIMADSERRQNAALNDMQQRISEITASAHNARNDVPDEFQGAFQRIENAMAHLAERIAISADSGRDAATANTMDKVSRNTTPTESEDQSAALQSLAALLDSEMNRPVPVASPAASIAQSPAMFDPAGNPEEPWDEADAEQLTQLYERGEAGLPPMPMASPIQPRVATAFNHEVTAAPTPPETAERGWIADQFSKLATQLEQTLSQSGKADVSLETVALRLENLENRFDHALDQLATRSDLSSLRDIEACVVELTTQFEQSQAELSRVEGIEWQIQELAGRLSEERVSAIATAASSTPEQPDFGALAEAIGQQIAEQSNAFEDDAPSETAEKTVIELGDVKGLLNNLIAEQRSEGKETIDRLEAMQQSMEVVLQRIEKIENTEPLPPASSPARPQVQDLGPAAYEYEAPGAPEPDQLQPRSSLDARVASQPRTTDIPGSAAPAAQMRPEPENGSANFDPEPHELDRPLAGSIEQRMPAPPKPDRQNFMAEARRAAAKANARAEVQPDDDDHHENNSAPSSWRPKTKSKSNSKAEDDAGKPNSSRTRLLVAAVAVIAIGISATNLLFGGSLLPIGGQTPATKPAPSSTVPAKPTTGSNQNGRAITIPAGPRATAALQGSGVPGTIVVGSNSDTPKLVAKPSPASLTTAPVKPSAPANAVSGARTQLSNDLPSALVGPLSLRLAAADGNPSAMFEVGTRYAAGRGVQQNFQEAIKWYTRAATKGFALAQYRLAALYERGLGGEKDLARAKIWYERAARQGNVKSMHNLAVLTAGSRAGSPDYTTAAHWFEEAAERGLADSQFNLAILYENGLGVPKNLQKAYHWFGIAERGGDQDAGKRRQALRSTIGEDASRKADATIEGWRRRVTNRIANDALFAGSQWKQRKSTIKTEG